MTQLELTKLREGDQVILRKVFHGLYPSEMNGVMTVTHKNGNGVVQVRLLDGRSRSISYWDIDFAPRLGATG